MAESPTVRLTSYSHGAGCGCKLSPLELQHVLTALPATGDARVLVEAGDDAAVFELDPGRGLVATVDFFTPIVDDPVAFGAVAAANSVSDVYAMGGRPLFALSLVAFPRELLEAGLLEQIVSGGATKLAEAGVCAVGGHSIDDPEPKFGYAVVGEVQPDRVRRQRGARPGDLLYLTKPLCSGLVATASKAGQCPPDLERRAIEVMSHLNRDAAAAMVEVGATAATDVTGFGLLGHLRTLGVGADIDVHAVPVLDGVRELGEQGLFPGGSRRNLEALDPHVEWGGAGEVDRLLLADAQTSGGLLVAIPPERASEFERLLAGAPWPAARIGTVSDGPIRIHA
ncbi:MAG TPA: selenide, water dikinase SelD [Candidatus Binatia bacterium]|nr:selenide, water dikinase SelD [Candidatus Binatia bacterium]